MITEATMTQEDMARAVKDGYLCRECQGNISVAWGGAHGVNGYILRCGKDINHTGITRHDTKHEEKLREGFSMDSNALMKMSETQMVKRVEMAKFPQDLTKGDKMLLAQAAISYGFDPIMNEISIYQGRPYISIDGRYRNAQETGLLAGVETRPATKYEREEWRIPEADFFFRADVYQKGIDRPFTGWGRVFGDEIKINKPGDAYKPVVKNPQRMAEKRAEAQALRKAFHIPLPSIEDIGSPDYDAESTARVIDATTKAVTEPSPQPASPSTSPEEVETGAKGKTTDELLDYICEVKGFNSYTTARNWLVKSAGYTAADIDTQPDRVYNDLVSTLK